MERKHLPDGVRFEVFKRDSFTCQYCGRKAPDVVLNCDHIKPVADGGSNEILNLVTACRDCNSGKSDKALDNSTAVEKARRQSEVMQERRRQIEMMSAWQIELSSMAPEVGAVDRLINSLGMGSLTPCGKTKIRKVIKKYGLATALSATSAAYNTYDSSIAFDKIERIAKCMKEEEARPGIGEIWKVVGAASRRFKGNTWGLKVIVDELYEHKAKTNDSSWAAACRDSERICNECGYRNIDDFIHNIRLSLKAGIGGPRHG